MGRHSAGTASVSPASRRLSGRRSGHRVAPPPRSAQRPACGWRAGRPAARAPGPARSRRTASGRPAAASGAQPVAHLGGQRRGDRGQLVVGEVPQLDPARLGGPHARARRPRAPRGRASPRCTSHSAISVARAKPSGAAAAIRSVSKRRVATLPVIAGSTSSRVSTASNDGLLVLLQVAVVGERQALERGQQRREVADQPPGLAAGQLGDVGVLLLRHDRGAGRPGVVERRPAELPRGPQADLLAEAGQVHADHRGDEEELGDEVAVADRVDGVGDRRVEAQLGGDRVRVQRRGPSRPARRRPSGDSAARRSQSASRSRSRPKACACLASSCPKDTGWACCRWVKPGAIVSTWASRLVERARRPGRPAPPRPRGPGRAGRAAGRWRPGRCGCARRAACRRSARAAPAGRARSPCGRPRPSGAATKRAVGHPRRPACRAPPGPRACSSSVEQPGPVQHPGVRPGLEQVVGRQPPVEVHRQAQRRHLRRGPAGEPAPHSRVGGTPVGSAPSTRRTAGGPAGSGVTRRSGRARRSRAAAILRGQAPQLDEALGQRLVERVAGVVGGHPEVVEGLVATGAR